MGSLEGESAGCAPRCLSYMDEDPILIKPHPVSPKMPSVSVSVGRGWLPGLEGGQRDGRRAGTFPREAERSGEPPFRSGGEEKK